jgi:hypothetical protein
MIDVVSVFCRRDLTLQRLQARSIARYFERSGLGRILYIWNDTSEMPAALREELAECMDGIAFELLSASELGVDSAAIAIDGWTTQQALKLLAARRVVTDSYLVLDAKIHLVQSCSIRDFVAQDGRGIHLMEDLGKSESYQYCREYFGVDPQMGACRGVLNVTPFVLKTAVVERMLVTFEQKEGCATAETFLAHQKKLSEFLAYQAYVLSERGKLSDLYQEARARIEVVIWGPTAQDVDEFECSMELLELGSVKVGGLHWMACCIMSAGQRARLCELWLSRGLVASAEEGQETIDSVARNLTEGDWKYLGSVGAKRKTGQILVPANSSGV